MKGLFTTILLACAVGCASVDPPPQVQIREQHLTPVSELTADAHGNFAAVMGGIRAEGPREQMLTPSAQNFRRRELLAAQAVAADAPEARATALSELRQSDAQAKDNKKNSRICLAAVLGWGSP